MFEKAFVGGKKYWGLILFWSVFIVIGFLCYLWQLKVGLKLTGMSRDVSWGFYIAQFTFLVGVAAGGVMVALPNYFHNYKKFGRIAVLGEFLAISALVMCLLFIFVDLGRPMRVLNVLLHPTPHSVMFWDMIVLNGYLLLNIIIGWTVLDAEKNGVAPPKWVKPVAYLSIPWAFGIHTVTAFLYCGLPARGFWLTAIMAPRFLASAFAAGPALLLILCILVRKYTKFDPGKEAIQTLGKIVAYAFIVNIFFLLCEVFTTFYSHIPEHMDHFKYLFVGLHGHGKLVPWMWLSAALAVVAIILLAVPATRKQEDVLVVTCILVFISTWIDKGLGLITGGFIPNPLEEITEYWPTFPELMITIGVWCVGFLVLTVLYKIAISVKEEVGG